MLIRQCYNNKKDYHSTYGKHVLYTYKAHTYIYKDMYTHTYTKLCTHIHTYLTATAGLT